MSQTSRSRSQQQVAHMIFDVDGTLVDNLDLIAKSFNLAVAEFTNREFSREELYALFGPTLERIIADIVPSDKLKDAIERYHMHYGNYFHASARTYPGIHKLISSLQNAGVKTSICTGSGERMTRTTLEEGGLDGMFSIIVTADDVSLPKPDPQAIILTMQLMKAQADQTVYLGDSVRDIEASRRAGIRSAAALWGFGNENKLRDTHPDFVFKDPLDALSLLV